MDCKRVRRALAAYCDDALSHSERHEIRLHLSGCRSCALRSEQFVQVRETLRQLPALRPPERLVTALRILASKERARRAGDLPFFIGEWALRTRIWASEMMRPLALPMAGGLLSALVLFGMLAPSFAPRHRPDIADVPTTLSTEATFLGMGPFGFGGDMVTVDVTVDSSGRLIDYSTPHGQEWVNDPEVRRSVENALLFTRFSPGTTFGKPAFARVRITLRRSEIDVRG